MSDRHKILGAKTALLAGLVAFALAKASPAQEVVPDTSQAAISTPKAPEKKSADIDTTVSYEALDIVNLLDERQTYLTRDAIVKYKNMVLKAGKISLDWNENLMIAEGRPDSAWVRTPDGTDSTLNIKTIDDPVLIDAGSQMTGAKMYYNYKTQKGRVVRGRTEFEGGHYLGQQIKKVGKDTYNVSHSNFSTCELDSNPHFHFEARRLKMITNDKVIAKPVIMYIARIPVAALPYAVFPNKSGRHSGILIPRYGESTSEGRYLRDMGYYWAPNDYFDNQFTADFFEKSGWLFRDDMNYAARYRFNGSISGSLTRKNFSTGTKSRRWDLQVRHNQEIDQTSRFYANGYFVSDKSFYKDLSPNLSTRLTRELRSNATYSKSWPEHKISMSLNVSHVRDLQDNTTQLTFPQMTFSKSSTQLFKPEKNKSGRRGSRERRQKEENKWYESLYYSYGSNLYNSRREYLQTITSDSSVKKVETTRKLSHSLNFNLSSPKKYFGWLSLNQSVNTNEDWFDEAKSFALKESTNVIESKKVKGFAARHLFSYSASANTKLYGMFVPGIGDIQAIRHVVTPSVSFTYQPDFSDPTWGYYAEVKDTTGKSVRQDRFSGTPSGGSKMVSLSVSNLFQMKKGVGEKEKKIDLFTMNFSTGFNFKAKQYRLSNLSSTWQANPANFFSLSANTSHSFYVFDQAANSRINRYVFDGGGWRHGAIMRLTSLNLNVSVRLQGKSEQKPEKKDTETDLEEAETGLPPGEEGENMDVLEENLARKGNRFETEQIIKKLNIPWRANMTLNFSLDKSNPSKPTKRYYMDISGAELSLTSNWRISYSAHYDLQEGTISYHTLSFYRNLHCWEAQIDWVPSGISKRFYFRINVKAPTLRDIKFERRGGTASVLGY
jgi:lipopolysaccharide assembly outer membrane protein LptD (OstA)